MLWDSGRDVGEKLQSLFVRLLSGDGSDGSDDLVEFELDEFQIELARLDFGKVEDVVDDREQGGAGVVNLAQVIALFSA
jgi:hypothetical protein